jgi:hypothetical protein
MGRAHRMPPLPWEAAWLSAPSWSGPADLRWVVERGAGWRKAETGLRVCTTRAPRVSSRRWRRVREPPRLNGHAQVENGVRAASGWGGGRSRREAVSER